MKSTKKLNITLHILTILLGFFCICFILFSGSIEANLLASIKHLPVAFGCFYFTNLWIAPKYFNIKNYLQLIFFSLLTIVISATASGYMYLLYDTLPSHSESHIYLNSLIFYTLVFLKAILVYVIIKFVDAELKKNEHKRKKDKSELELLLFQIQPHFLFNTINNIYALALENSKKVPNALIQLTTILKHIVYNCNENRTLLCKEIEAVNTYIDILQIGFEKKLNISVDVSLTKSVLIPCASLLTLFESAVKHSYIGKTDNSFIKISGFADNKNLTITISNSIYTHNQSLEYSGIGLQNLTKRLSILYPHNHNTLVTEASNDIFKAVLNIPI